jgi:hypothetical protein
LALQSTSCAAAALKDAFEAGSAGMPTLDRVSRVGFEQVAVVA